MQLPCLFLADSNALIHPKLYTEVTPIGEEATGTGPVQDLFNSYFKELSKLDIFDVDENTTMILPTAAASASKERIDEIERIFYGLGVVFLKTLIDMRQMGGVNDVNNKKMPTELIFHPWIFQALSWKFSSNTKHLLNESLLYDYKFAEFLSSAKESNNIEFIKYEVTTNKLFLFNRKLFFRAIYDGFNLNYRRGFLPKSFKTEMEKSKKELTEFYKIINSISPESVQLLIVGSPRIHAHVLLDKFIFQAYEGVDLSGEGSDKLMDLSKSPQNAKLFEKVKNIFRNYIKKLCDKPQQTKIKRFLSYLFGVPSFSPLMHEKWLFAVSFYSRAKFLDAFACDRFVIVPMFDSEKELDEIVNNTLINHEKDAVSRDVIYARQVHDTFDPKNE
ncbi:hypothetical protein GPJ56_010548 [Histomonas meleagridis]|uniref:uncharacterized protein n=1 Tax=Histomonas meleagridis TaxID=135588 RepID=UPI003559CCAA|nr:hypothetical protein GPJ56_010548 [Histomonas meleagridis]KAH0797994.1 hypothetical protein GO595_009213 [Histomonas meleagridis]